MKVLFYISTIRGGGAARVMVNIANGLATQGNNVFFVTNFPAEHEYALDKRIQRLSLEEQERTGNMLVRNALRIRALRRILKKEKPTVGIAFMRENNFRFLLAAKGLPMKTIVSVRNDPTREYPGRVSRILAGRLYAEADGIVLQTEDAKACFSQQIQKKSRIIQNQVDEEFFQEYNAEGQYILACGRLSPQKNYAMMLRAFSVVLRDYPGEQLRIYGEGALKQQLESYAGELGISESVSFEGFTNRMADIYKNAKFLLMSSDFEGMPNVILEALASSVPVISTDCPCGGPRMLLVNGENGYLSPVRDELAFAERIKQMLSDEKAYLRMRDRAFQSAKRFRPEKVLQEWEKMIVDTSRTHK